MRRRGIEGVAERYCQELQAALRRVRRDAGRYRGLREARDGLPAVSITGLVVGPEVAAAQFAREKAATSSRWRA
jgi:hypothetical protein